MRLKHSVPPIQYIQSRAVGAGPAGPAAAGPIFGQLTRAKMPYAGMSFGGLFNCSAQTRMTAVIHKSSVGAGGKHTLSEKVPVEA